jgi:predicted nucleic acid-binding protein
MKIVSDTGPIIGLAKIGKIFFLEHFTDEVLIPPMVHKELLGKIGPESKEIDNALYSFIKTANLPQTEDKLQNIISELDEGEKQAITLAYAYSEDILLLMDDRAGREAASKLGIPITGLLGLLIRLKEKGFIQDIGSLIEELRQNGYWLSDDIVWLAKKLAGE